MAESVKEVQDIPSDIASTMPPKKLHEPMPMASLEKHRRGSNDSIETQKELRTDISIEKAKAEATASAVDPEQPPPTTTPDNDLLTRTQSHIPLSKARKLAMVATLTGATFLNTLSVQSAIIVLPTIGRDLSIPPARQQWIVSSYALAFGCFLLLWGRVADVYGKRMIFVGGSAWVFVCTLVCPWVGSEVGFDVLRGLQGLGAAANVPTAIGILSMTFPPGKAKAYAFSVFSSGAPMGSVIGNILGGIVGQYAGWRWIFWILAILAAITTIAGYLVIPVLPAPSSKASLLHTVDWIGGAMVTIALFALMFALTEGNVVGWGKAYIPVIIVLSLLLLSGFVFWQLYLEKRTTRRPLMKMTIFKNVRVCAAMMTMALFFTVFNNFLIFATYYYQEYNGLSPIQTTLRFIPTGVAGLLTILVVSQLLARISVQYIVLFGTTSVTISALLFAVPIPPKTTYWAFGFPAMCLSVMGADTLYPSLLLFNSSQLPKEDQALGGALISAVAQIGRAIGLAIATAIQVAVQESREGKGQGDIMSTAMDLHNNDFLEGLRAGNWYGVGIGCCALLIVVFGFRGAGVVGATSK